jgi:hypothetical protein
MAAKVRKRSERVAGANHRKMKTTFLVYYRRQAITPANYCTPSPRARESFPFFLNGCTYAIDMYLACMDSYPSYSTQSYTRYLLLPHVMVYFLPFLPFSQQQKTACVIWM